MFFMHVDNSMCSCCYSYRPTLPLCFVTKQLGFGADSELGKWLAEKNIPLTDDGTKIDCKVAMATLASF